MLARPLLVPAIRLDRGETVEETRRALRRAAEPWCAGFLLFGGDAEGVARLTARLRDAAGRDLLVAADMERGAGQQVRGLTTHPEARILGLGATPADVETLARQTAREAASVGIDVLFAPVLDVSSEPTNPIVGERAFDWDPARVATLGGAFLRGVRAEGALAVAKHYPGHGATTLDSHVARPVVRARRALLEARDLVPFHRALDRGLLDAVMTAHVAYPALDAEGRIATESPPIIDALRARAAPSGVVVVTDALTMAGALGDGGPADAARRALAAGADLLLYADDEEAVAAALPDDAGEAQAARVAAWLSRRGDRPHPPLAASEAIERAAADAVRRSVDGAAPDGAVWILDDADDVPDRGLLLAAFARGSGRVVRLVRLSEGAPPAHEALRGAGVVVTMASVRMAKGPGGWGPAFRTFLDGWPGGPRAPRLVAMGAWTPLADAHVPGTHPAVERALARALFETFP